MYNPGVGKHIFCLPTENVEEVLKWSTLTQMVEVITIAVVKISVCLLVLRVIEKAERRISQFLWALMGFVVASHFAAFLLYVLQCRPLAAVWNPSVHGTCYSQRNTYIAAYIAIGKCKTSPSPSSQPHT